MRLHSMTSTSIIALLLCSCATEGQDQAAVAVSTQQESAASPQDTAAQSTTATGTETSVPTEGTGQSTSSGSTSVVTDGTTGTTAVANEGSTTTTQAATTGTADATTQTAAATAATAADVKKGVSVYDQAGGLVGTIDSVSADAAVVSTGKVKATIPLTSFGKNDKGLVLVMSKAELEAAAKTP